jgi:hypothetical protein
MRKIQLFLGLILAAGAFVGVLLVGQATQPPVYDVAVVMKEIPAFTALTQDMFATDSQSVSPAVADKYVMAGDLLELIAANAVAVENLRPGQPLLREQVASGAKAEGLSRLAVALNDPNLVIVSVPVQPNNLPAVFPGDVIALFYASGNVQAQTIATATIEGPLPTPTPIAFGAISETTIVTTELQMPIAKWIANGVVYKLNREIRENPNYGAPGKDTEPRYIEGAVQSLDIVVRRDVAEWVAFALANGKVQVGVLPAVTRPDVEKGTLARSEGVTWSDFEKRFFEDREGVK